MVKDEDRYQEQIDRYRPRIAEELSALDGLMDTAADDSQPVQLDQQSVGRLARMDAMQRQAMASETHRRRQRRLLQLRQAPRRMDEGEFGYCENCGEEIPDRRLDIDPAFLLCVKCAG